MGRRIASWRAVVVTLCVIGATAAPAAAQEQAGDPPLASAVLRELVAEGTPSDAVLDGLDPLGSSDPSADGTTPEVVTVEVLSSAPEATLRGAVEAHGGRVTGAVAGHLVQADVPVDALVALEAEPEVRMLRPPLQVGLPEAGAAPDVVPAAVTGQQVAKTMVGPWHDEGWRGQGLEIGIIDSFERAAWDSAVAAGELPEGEPKTFCSILGASCDAFALPEVFADDHGVAVAEVIHDMAPEAELHLAVVYTAADLQAAIDWFDANGVRVINRSQTAEFDGPGNGTGPTAAVVDDAVASGMLWANSAGNNSGTTGNTGDYYRSEWRDGNANGYHDFSPGPGEDEVMEVRCNFTNGVRWSDWGAPNPTDYDVEVYSDEAATNLLGSSTDDQTAGAPPLELLNFKLIGRCQLGVDDVFVKLKLSDPGNGTAGDVIELMANQSRFEYWQNPYGASGPMSDSANPGLLSVGAIDPALGTTLASYSSWGPTNDERMKPDLSAASCLITHTTGGGCFNGTSAASPTVAGAAAVVMSSGLHGDPVGTADYLRAAAVDRGDPGPDDRTGLGELILPAPPPAPDAGGEVHTVDPMRVLDTRSGLGRPAPGPLSAGTTAYPKVLGQGGVPSEGVAAVVVNLTGVDATHATHLTAFTAGARLPATSSLNLAAGETAANLVTIPIDPSLGGTFEGTIAIFNNTGFTHVVADVVGWIDDGTVEGGEVVPLDTAVRAYDTRRPLGLPMRPLGPGETVGLLPFGLAVPDAARGVGADVLAPGDLSAVLVSVTAITPTADTHLTLWSGGPRPATSNLNVAAGDVRSNLVLVPVGDDGTYLLRNNSGNVDVAVDVVGWVDDGTGEAGEVGVLPPARIIDQRSGLGEALGAGGFISGTVGGPPVAGGWTTYRVAGHGGVPEAGAAAVLVNVTVVGGPGDGHVAVVGGASGDRPSTSTVNVGPGDTRAVAALVPLGDAGELTVYEELRGDGVTSAGRPVVIDVVGWVGTPPPT